MIHACNSSMKLRPQVLDWVANFFGEVLHTLRHR